MERGKRKIGNDVPFEVRYARGLNVVTIIVLIVPLGLLFAAIGVPNLLKAANIRIYFPNPIIRLITFLLFIFVGLIPAYLLMRLNKALLRLEKKAQKAQIILSTILLIGFPVFTVLYGICLYYFTRPNIKEQFK